MTNNNANGSQSPEPERELSPDEIAKKFDAIRERIRKVEEEALKKLKKGGGDQEPA